MMSYYVNCFRTAYSIVYFIELWSCNKIYMILQASYYLFCLFDCVHVSFIPVNTPELTAYIDTILLLLCIKYKLSMYAPRVQKCSGLQFISTVFLLWLWEHAMQVYCVSLVKLIWISQKTCQRFAVELLHRGILEVICKPRDRGLSVSIKADLKGCDEFLRNSFAN
jgi:hypothetical protein